MVLGAHRPLAYAEYENSDDLIKEILRKEFSASTEKADPKHMAKFDFKLKSRDEHLKNLKDPDTEYDILIIGGGANGAGVVLDAAARGLKCAVVDSYDFAAGTSSKSTKMAHGGIRYFQQMCLLQGDPVESYQLLKETLNERNYFLQAAPYLIRELHLLIPSKSAFWTAVWYWPGAFGYHLIYLMQLMKSNYNVSVDGPKFVSKNKLRRDYPECKELHGGYGAVMSEAQMVDSRMNLNTLFTSAIDDYIPGMKGATLANYTEMKEFTKDDNGKINGAVCVDKLDPSGKPFTVKAKVVINCAGVHADELRKMDNPEVTDRIVPSRGTHLMFKKGLIGENQGFIIPETSDGRLLFVINYYGHPMVGTTDVLTDSTHNCEPTQEEIDFIIEDIKPFFGKDYDYKNNLMSAWAGLRPLVKSSPTDKVEVDPKSLTFRQRFSSMLHGSVRWIAFKVHGGKKSSSTKAISRNHVIEVAPSGLVSLMGGKWTAFRIQGEETVDRILHDNPGLFKESLKNEEGQTLNFNLIGSYSKMELLEGVKQVPEKLFKQYEDQFVFEYDLPRDVAKHLVKTYGTTAIRVIELGKENDLNKRLLEDYPFTEAEILFGLRYQMAQKPNDIICRRVPISFIYTDAARDIVLPRVVEIMAKELKWSEERKQAELAEAI